MLLDMKDLSYSLVSVSFNGIERKMLNCIIQQQPPPQPQQRKLNERKRKNLFNLWVKSAMPSYGTPHEPNQLSSCLRTDVTCGWSWSRKSFWAKIEWSKSSYFSETWLMVMPHPIHTFESTTASCEHHALFEKVETATFLPLLHYTTKTGEQKKKNNWKKGAWRKTYW